MKLKYVMLSSLLSTGIVWFTFSLSTGFQMTPRELRQLGEGTLIGLLIFWTTAGICWLFTKETRHLQPVPKPAPLPPPSPQLQELFRRLLEMKKSTASNIVVAALSQAKSMDELGRMFWTWRTELDNGDFYRIFGTSALDVPWKTQVRTSIKSGCKETAGETPCPSEPANPVPILGDPGLKHPGGRCPTCGRRPRRKRWRRYRPNPTPSCAAWRRRQ